MRRTARAVTTLAVTLPLTGGLLLAATPAGAAVRQPGEGTVFTTDTTIGIRADYPSGPSSLTLTSPGGGPVTVATGGSRFGGAGELTYSLDTSCWTYPSSSCSGRVPAPNGTWVLEQSGGATDRLTFVVRIAPQAPAGLTAEPVDSRSVRLTWRRGVEPDLVGYAVQEGGATVREVPASACDGGTCVTTVTYGSDGTGDHAYAVKAVRSDGNGGTVESGASGASATLAAPPPQPQPQPQPGASTGSGDGSTDGSTGGTGGSTGGTGGTGTGGTPAPGGSTGTGGGGTGDGGTGGGAGGGGTGGTGGGSGGGSAPIGTGGSASPSSSAVDTAVAQRKAFALSFSAFGPKLGIPKLPPLPQTQAPDVAPLPDGTFEPTLGFTDQVVTERVESQGPAARVTTAVGRALDSEQLVRSTAAALVLLLVGAHLRRWLAATPQD